MRLKATHLCVFGIFTVFIAASSYLKLSSLTFRHLVFDKSFSTEVLMLYWLAFSNLVSPQAGKIASVKSTVNITFSPPHKIRSVKVQIGNWLAVVAEPKVFHQHCFFRTPLTELSTLNDVFVSHLVCYGSFNREWRLCCFVFFRGWDWEMCWFKVSESASWWAVTEWWAGPSGWRCVWTSVIYFEIVVMERV